MKKLIFSFAICLICFLAQSQTWVNGYTKLNGTYVEGYYRTTPNETNWDNYSTRDNLNPYKGTEGYKAKDYSIESYNYGNNQVIYTGPNGGQYYYNSNGNKTYVPKR